MKTVFTANKASYGSGFMEVCDSLDELKRTIVRHSFHWEDEVEYSEELFLKCVIQYQYTLYEIELHDDEYVGFGEYDGTSWFHIDKKIKNIFSSSKRVEI